MSTKEQIDQAARKQFLKKEFELDDGIVVTIKELSSSEKKELHKRLFICDENGEPKRFNSQDEEDPDGDDWKYNEGISPTNEWIAATIDPEFTADELEVWPMSLRTKLYKFAHEINGISIKEASGN